MNHSLKFILSILSGLSVGAILALIFTPKKGSDNYKQMVKFTRDFSKEFISQGKEGLEATVKKWQN